MRVRHDQEFLKAIEKIKHQTMQEKILKQIEKVIDDPEIGKPMRYGRKGTREVYVAPYRLAYAYDAVENIVTFLKIYHKDEQ